MDIAIIGFFFNVPGARNVDTFSDLLSSENDAYSVPAGVWEHPEGWVSRAGYISREAEFDYPLFGISLRDSLMIEPQLRLFIQHGWKELEQAGYNPRAVGSRVGVYSTFSDSNYVAYLHDTSREAEKYKRSDPEAGANKEL